jgi:hypothetical protein
MAAPAKAAQLPWDIKMQELLFHAVLEKDAHISPAGKASVAAWTEVGIMFFAEPDLASYRADHFNGVTPKDSFRKLKEKYTAVFKAIKNNQFRGNKSDKEDGSERSELCRLAQTIDQEITEKVDQGLLADDLKVQLDHTATSVLAGKRKKPVEGWGERTGLDGKIIANDNSKSSRSSSPRTNSLEQVLLNHLNVLPSASSPSFSSAPMTCSVDEKATEKKFLEWTKKQRYEAEDLASESGLKFTKYADDLDILMDLGIEAIINIYCCVGQKFANAFFHTRLLEMRVRPLVIQKIFVALEKWREQATALSGPPAAVHGSRPPSPSMGRLIDFDASQGIASVPVISSDDCFASLTMEAFENEIQEVADV